MPKALENWPDTESWPAELEKSGHAGKQRCGSMTFGGGGGIRIRGSMPPTVIPELTNGKPGHYVPTPTNPCLLPRRQRIKTTAKYPQLCKTSSKRLEKIKIQTLIYCRKRFSKVDIPRTTIHVSCKSKVDRSSPVQQKNASKKVLQLVCLILEIFVTFPVAMSSVADP
jgi:hypothetical protein